MKLSAQLLALAISASSLLPVEAKMQRERSSHRSLAKKVKRDGVAYEAIMYWGHQGGETGACGEAHKDNEPVVGLQTTMFGKGGECGKFVEIKNMANNKTTIAPVYDSCAGCTDSNDLVSSMYTFEQLGGNLDDGVLDVVWTWVDGPASTPAPKEEKKEPAAPKQLKQAAQKAAEPAKKEPEPVQPEAPAPVLKEAHIDNTQDEDCEEWESWASDSSSSAEKQEPTPEKKVEVKAKVAKVEAQVEVAQPEMKNAKVAAPSAEGFKLTHDLRGQDLLNFFDMEKVSGDNGGFADWVQDGSLQYVNAQGNVVLATDSTPRVDARKTTRAVSKETFNKGLFISRITHMPSTYGSWPSFWIVGASNWPASGEIDVLEGVGSFSQNAASVHTNAGCSMPASALSETTSQFMLKGDQQTNCDAMATDTQGCGLRDDTPNTFGPGFNSVGGAYVAVHITDDFIKIHQWAGDSAPEDVKNNAPAPSTWKKPALYLPNTQCNIGSHFYDLKLVFSTNVCGRWPSDLWHKDASYAGQSQSSAQATGVDSCYEYAHNNGAAWSEAFFEIASISIFS